MLVQIPKIYLSSCLDFFFFFCFLIAIFSITPNPNHILKKSVNQCNKSRTSFLISFIIYQVCKAKLQHFLHLIPKRSKKSVALIVEIPSFFALSLFFWFLRAIIIKFLSDCRFFFRWSVCGASSAFMIGCVIVCLVAFKNLKSWVCSGFLSGNLEMVPWIFKQDV